MFLLTKSVVIKQTQYVSRFPLWTLVHLRVSPYLIIGFWVLVGFVGYLCCVQRHQNQNHTSNYLCRKFWVGGRGDTYTFWVYDFFRFHHNYFRDTISWECIVKYDCVRSCLIELQSFPLSKLYIDPIHRVLVPSPLLLVQCKTWFGQTKLLRILVILIHGFHGCTEYRLSVVCSNFALPVSILNL